MTIHVYYPELDEDKPSCEIEASLCYYGKHYFLRTFLVLKGRGIEYIKTYQSKDLSDCAQHKIGQHSYQATRKAFEKLQEQSSISYKILLD